MLKEKVGSRVGAVLSAKNGVLKLLGYGVYLGNLVPPSNRERAILTAARCREVLSDTSDEDPDPEATAALLALSDEELVETSVKPANSSPFCPWRNPCILLDGEEQYVWGSECWWGPENEVRGVEQRYRESGDDKIVIVSIREARIEAGVDADRVPLSEEEDPFRKVLSSLSPAEDRDEIDLTSPK